MTYLASSRFKLFAPPRIVLAVWMVHVGISLAFGLILQAYPELPASPWYYTPDWAGNLSHWDVEREARIADQGYGPDFFPQTSAKFPLTAMSARSLYEALGVPIQVALFALNKLSALAGLWALWRLVAVLDGHETATLAVGYMGFSLLGTSYIAWMSYPDVLFLVWWALAFTDFFERQYYRAGLWTTLAVWTRPQGAVLIAVFGASVVIQAVKHYRRRYIPHNEREGKDADTIYRASTNNESIAVESSSAMKEESNIHWMWTRLMAVCAAPTLGLALWVTRVSDITGIPFSPYVGQVDSGRGDLMWPWQRLALRVSGMVANRDTLYPGIWLESGQLILILFGLGILVYACWRKWLRWELLAFTGLSIFLPLLTRIMAIGRFSTLTWLPIAFVYVIPARWKALHGILWGAGLGLSMFVMIALNVFPREFGYLP